MPIAFASAAATSRARKRISRARTMPTVLATSVKLNGAVQLPSVRATGAPNRACSAANRRSHASERKSPPPTASPCTIAIVGFVTAASRRSTRPMRAS
jgi:hypothetical protein